MKGVVENTNSSVLLHEGHELFFAEPPDFRGAAVAFEKVVSQRPDWAEGHYWLGTTYESLSREEEAEREWLIAIELDSSDSRPIISLGILRLGQKRFEEAIALLERGIALKPHYGFADAKLFLADALEGAGNIERAKNEWREVLELEPMYPSYDEPINEARQKLLMHDRSDS